ncbi:hypothetical protein [Streptomyces naganishii]|uniref:Uncharacterized protein n=1 Tax=Streptomyces naganishii JCM 4654 TaxID=1306179 RepID=A0A918Y885_9ACTN|nr:hypothetical protein [Streptomyces naganishii]GHD93626.1 hypothetical protein GCM10010508_51250 [Streptomyces naganishii JCM 4654]
MEQRIGPSSQPLKSDPVKGAGFDPAFIPGLTTPAPAEREDEAAPADAETPADAATRDEPGAPAERTAPAEPTEASAEGDEPAPEASEGPVFEAADRRARIVADHKGVRLSLDDQECEFRWDEIGAVETETPRFGKRFTVTVHTPDRRWYPIEIEATSRSAFPTWESELDAVLDAYFEESTAEPAKDED